MSPEEAKKILEQAKAIEADKELMKKVAALDSKKGPKSIEDLHKMREEMSKEPEEMDEEPEEKGPKIEIEVQIHNSTPAQSGANPMDYMADEDKVALREIAKVEKSIADCFPEKEED